DLINAASRGDRAAVQALLDGGADVNAKPNERCPPAFGLGDPVCGTALIAASLFGRLDVVKALLDRGPPLMPRMGTARPRRFRPTLPAASMWCRRCSPTTPMSMPGIMTMA